MDSEISDQQLLRDFLGSRDERLLRVLMERHLPLVYAVALRISGSPELAAETAQDVFLKLTRTPAALMKEGIPLIALLHRTARHRALDLARSEKSRKAREQAAAVPDDTSAREDTLSPEALSVVDEVIEKLPPLDRDLVLERYFLGRSLAAIGKQNSLSEDAVRMRLKRSLEKLRGLLQSRGITTTTALLSSSLPLHALSAPPPAVTASVMKAVTASAGAAPKISLSLLTYLMTATQKSILVGSLLVCAGVLTLALRSRSASQQEDAQTPHSSKTAADGSFSDQTASKSPARPKTALGQEYASLIQKYGESRTKLAIHVAQNTAQLSSDTAVIDQSPSFAKQQHDARQFLLNQLSETLGLRDEQKDQLLQMLPDLDRKETDWTAKRAQIVAENPAAIAEANLAMDLWSQDKMNETEVREVLAKASEKLGGDDLDVLEMIGIYETKTSTDPLEHFPEMTRQLEASLDADQLQKYRECQGETLGANSRPIQKRSLEDADIGMERSMKQTGLWADDVRAGRK